MDKHAERTVQLRVDIPEALRTRLKTQSVRRGITMGDLLQDLIEEPLRSLEIEALEEAKAEKANGKNAGDSPVSHQ